jgi:trk system potassium uptake protein TrkA
VIPRGHTVIEEHDRVVILSAANAIKKLEQMFAVRLEFF